MTAQARKVFRGKWGKGEKSGNLFLLFLLTFGCRLFKSHICCIIRAVLDQAARRVNRLTNTGCCVIRVYHCIWWIVASIPSTFACVNRADATHILDRCGDANLSLDCTTMFKVNSHTSSLHLKHNAAKVKSRIIVERFHGSPSDNWYSILKHGLLVMSNHPEYKLHGSNFGAGIYVTPCYQTARQYTRSHQGFVSLVAICEVVDSDEDIFKGNYWVVKNPELVGVKYLLVEKN